MSDDNTTYELTVNGSEFADAMRLLDRTSKRSAANEMTLTFADGELVGEISGAAVGVPAEGTWPGTVTLTRTATSAFARAGTEKIVIAVTSDDRLKVGGTSFACRRAPLRSVSIDLPLDPTLVQLLRLRGAHADEELLAAGLLEQVKQAEKKLADMIDSAALRLKEVGDYRRPIDHIVRRQVYDEG
ncbi:hypothetical protein BH23GEM9_BH23GEM9_20240 [soil metagenome]